jgi:hypothetical protein
LCYQYWSEENHTSLSQPVLMVVAKLEVYSLLVMALSPRG